MSLYTKPVDAVFDSLSSPRRRALIELLDEHRSEGVSLRKVADEIGAHEVREDATEGELKNSQQAVYVSLYQAHGPKLEEHGIVEMEQRGTGQGNHYVRAGPHFDLAVRTMRAAEGERTGSIADRLCDLL